MGIKVCSGVNAIAATCNGGFLKYKVGTKSYEIWIPGIDKYINIVEPQCNHFKCANVMALLTDAVYSVVLRFNGTGCIFMNKSRILVKSFTFPYEHRDWGTVMSGGTFFQTSNGSSTMHMPAELFTQDDDNYILTCNSPVSLCLNVNENQEYFRERKLGMSVSFPPLQIVDNVLCRVDVNKKKVYELNGVLSTSPGFIQL